MKKLVLLILALVSMGQENKKSTYEYYQVRMSFLVLLCKLFFKHNE